MMVLVGEVMNSGDQLESSESGTLSEMYYYLYDGVRSDYRFMESLLGILKYYSLERTDITLGPSFHDRSLYIGETAQIKSPGDIERISKGLICDGTLGVYIAFSQRKKVTEDTYHPNGARTICLDQAYRYCTDEQKARIRGIIEYHSGRNVLSDVQV